MSEIENPFPMVGCNSEIDPIGYDRKIQDIKNIVVPNAGKNPIIINIYGEYGQGKTTVLNFLQNKFEGEWANLSVFKEDISTFPDLEENLVLYQKEHEKEGTEAVFLILDEVQHIDIQGAIELSTEQIKFLNLLRRFADNNIDNVDNKKFILCIGMHPGTKAFLNEYGYLDVEQRIKTGFTLNLHSNINYYMAYMLVKAHFDKINKNFNDFFDESFIYSFYTLLAHLEDELFGTYRFNGRTFTQLFFNLLEFWREKKLKLTSKDLKDILLEKHEFFLGDAKLTLVNKKKYLELYENLDDNERYIFDKFVFNPRWHFKNEFESIDEHFISKLIDKKIISKRTCVIITPNEFSALNHKTRSNLNTLSKDTIYKNGEKFIIFLDTADDRIYDEIENFKISDIYRLNDEILDILYDFKPGTSPDDEIIIEYFKKDSPEKVKFFYRNLIKNMNPETFINYKITNTKQGIKYRYLDAEYRLFGGITHRVAIFYYAKDYGGSEMAKYFSDIKSELQNSSYDLGIIFVCPYYIQELPQDKTVIRKMENRLFINHLTRENMIDFLKGDSPVINESIKESIKVYTQEAVDVGFTLPLTGFVMKIENKPKEFEKTFLEDIENSWKIELDKKAGENRRQLSSVLKRGVDGGLGNLAKDSLSEFVEINDYGEVYGAKFSKYEKRFLEIFGTQQLPEFELIPATNRYFSKFSRFDIVDYVSNILEIKSIMEVEGKKPNRTFKLIEPTDYLLDFLDLLNSIDFYELLKKDQDISIRRSISDLKILLDSLDTKKIDVYEKGYYNSEMRKILNNLSNIEIDDPNLIETISKKFKEINGDLKLDLGEISLQDINVSSQFKEMEKESQLKDLYRNCPKLMNMNQSNILSFIANILKQDINLETDRELLRGLEELIEMIEKYGLQKECSIIKEKILSFKSKNKDKNTDEIIINLNGLFDDSESNFSTHQMKIIENVLEDLKLGLINPVQEEYYKLKIQLDEIKEIKNKLEDFKIVSDKLKVFKRHDAYLDKIMTLKTDPNEIDNEISNIIKISKYNIEILDGYLKFVNNSLKKEDFENINSMEIEINTNEKKSLLEYLEFVSELNSEEYLKNSLKKQFKDNYIPEKKLTSVISILKNSENELKNRDDNEIINEILLPAEFVRRIIQTEEYYKNGEKTEDITVEYKIGGI